MEAELAAGEIDVWSYDRAADGVLVEARPKSDGSTPKDHVFDWVFPPDAPTMELYEAMGEPLVTSALEGYNGTLFAYGQTGISKPC
jgi:hypothetical protein